MKRALSTLLILATLSPVALAQAAPETALVIPKEKQTTLGLYLTPTEAYAKWKADPEHVKVIDVRTPEEYIFVGHPAMAWNVPLAFQTYEWDPSGKKLPMKPNPEFVAEAKALFDPSDTLLLICRSGGRSAKAVNALAAAGYKQAWSIVDGVEGDLVEDRQSPQYGTRAKNGWKNDGLPFTYELDPSKLRLPASTGETPSAKQ